MNKLKSFTLSATSKDPNGSGDQANCSLVVNFTLIEENNRTMWAVGGAPPTNLTANYPGMVKM